MTLTYIFHSGFALETSSAILIFDYWHDPASVMPTLLDKPKPMYVFSSHFHEDHFTRKIFNWRRRSSPITYILSKDILRHRRAQAEEANVWMGKGARWQTIIPGTQEVLSVVATGSNDSGVSWVINIEGRTIFHAGDLCNWYARFLGEGTPAETVYSEEFGEYVHPAAEQKRFLGELKDIRKVTQRMDLALFPVDGRIGNGYTLGGRQLIERFEIGLFVPMHFVASGFESAWRMEPYCQEQDIEFWCIEHEGETREL